jgi:hypothetical protein
MRLLAASCSRITCLPNCHMLDPYQRISINDSLQNIGMLRDRAAAVGSAAAAATATGAPASARSSASTVTGACAPAAAVAGRPAERGQLAHLDSVYVVDLCAHVVHTHFIVAVHPVGAATPSRICSRSVQNDIR